MRKPLFGATNHFGIFSGGPRSLRGVVLEKCRCKSAPGVRKRVCDEVCSTNLDAGRNDRRAAIMWYCAWFFRGGHFQSLMCKSCLVALKSIISTESSGFGWNMRHACGDLLAVEPPAVYRRHVGPCSQALVRRVISMEAGS